MTLVLNKSRRTPRHGVCWTYTVILPHTGIVSLTERKKRTLDSYRWINTGERDMAPEVHTCTSKHSRAKLAGTWKQQ